MSERSLQGSVIRYEKTVADVKDKDWKAAMLCVLRSDADGGFIEGAGCFLMCLRLRYEDVLWTDCWVFSLPRTSSFMTLHLLHTTFILPRV